jgi:hypothetical protein
LICPGCRTSRPYDARFCERCGAGLADALREARAAVEVTHSRARVAAVAVLLSAVLLEGWRLHDESRLAPLVGLLFAAIGWVISLAAGIAYCRWLSRAYQAHRHLAGRSLRLSPTPAVWSFFVPILNLYRPYLAVRDLYAASDPRTLRDTPQYKPASATDYRSSARELVPPPRWERWCSLPLWWIVYQLPLVQGLVIGLLAVTTRVDMSSTHPGYQLVVFLEGLLSAVLAGQVIRAIDARQNERLRRLEALHQARGEELDAVAAHATRGASGTSGEYEVVVLGEEDQILDEKRGRGAG